jgi:hypothetical protein
MVILKKVVKHLFAKIPCALQLVWRIQSGPFLKQTLKNEIKICPSMPIKVKPTTGALFVLKRWNSVCCDA